MKRAAALAAAILAVAFAVAAVAQTVRLNTAQQTIDTLQAGMDGLQSELDTLNGQLTEEQAARREAEDQLAELQKKQALQDAQAAKADIQDGDEIGRVWVEGTQVDCTLYTPPTAVSCPGKTVPSLWALIPTAGLWT